MTEKQEPKQDMPFTKSLVKATLRRMIKECDADEERDFLKELGKLHRNVVYENKYLTDEQFDEMSRELLDELEFERNES